MVGSCWGANKEGSLEEVMFGLRLKEFLVEQDFLSLLVPFLLTPPHLRWCVCVCVCVCVVGGVASG